MCFAFVSLCISSLHMGWTLLRPFCLAALSALWWCLVLKCSSSGWTANSWKRLIQAPFPQCGARDPSCACGTCCSCGPHHHLAHRGHVSPQRGWPPQRHHAYRYLWSWWHPLWRHLRPLSWHQHTGGCRSESFFFNTHIRCICMLFHSSTLSYAYLTPVLCGCFLVAGTTQGQEVEVCSGISTRRNMMRSNNNTCMRMLTHMPTRSRRSRIQFRQVRDCMTCVKGLKAST